MYIYPNKNTIFQLLRQWTRSQRYKVTGFILVALIAALVVVVGFSKVNYAVPYLGCDPNGYIVKDATGHTEIQAIDMVTGQGQMAGTVPGRQLNAIGYNPMDNNFYAWDLQNQKFVRVSSDFSTVTELTIASYPGGAPTNNIFSGDVDINGHYWFFVGNTWYEIDLTTTPNPTYIGSGTPVNPTGSNGTDWAFVPGTNNLYRAMDQGGSVHIWAFDRTSKTYSSVGAVANISTATDGDMGAVYADPNMNFYISSHNSGKLFRINLNETAPFTAVELDAADPNNNDGARCALASVPTDYGDAPSSYSTLITDASDGGPRHNVESFNIFESTAPLMLGKKIDIENDGFPTVDATGDDADHEGIQGGQFIDDERGVTHIVVTPGTLDPLNIPAYTVNNSGQAATLVGWVDLDNDGVFETSERISTSVSNGFAGYKQLTFPAPAVPYSTNTFARFRLFSAADTSIAATNLSPTGPATGGEVEDVLVQVGTYEVNKTANPSDGSLVDPGAVVTYTLTIHNTGLTVLTNLKIDDDLSGVLDDAALEGVPNVNPASAGTANITDTMLEFVGDIGIGATATVTYAVKVKDAATLGDTALNNFVFAAHSANCHPEVSDTSTTVNNPDCMTNHTVAGLAKTGINVVVLLLLSASLLALGVVTFFLWRKKSALHVQ